MFRPARMRHVLIQLLKDDLPQATLALAETEFFAPDHREPDEHSLRDVPGQHYREIFRQATSRLEKVTGHFPAHAPVKLEKLHVVTERELNALNNRLGVLWQECSVCQEQQRRLDEEWRLVRQLQNTLDNFANLQLDLGLLEGEKTFLDVNIGVVPAANLQRMEEALSLARFLVYRFLLSEGIAHVVVVGQKGVQAQHVASVLESAGFHPLPIPPELRDEPSEVERQLAERRAHISRDRKALEQHILQRAAENAAFMNQARITLALAEPFVNLDNAVRSSSQLAIISGWVPARHLSVLDNKLTEALDQPFLMVDRRPPPGKWPKCRRSLRIRPCCHPLAHWSRNTAYRAMVRSIPRWYSPSPLS